jgi:hypothetical protein
MRPMLAALVASVAAMPAHSHPDRAGDPGNAAARVPPLRYESAFVGFRGMRDDKPASWKLVNEEVSAAGHAGHGAPKVPAPPVEPSRAPATKPAPTRPEAAQPAKPPGHSHRGRP